MLEKRSVVLVTDLGEMHLARCRIGDELEAVLRARRKRRFGRGRLYLQLDRGGGLEELAPERRVIVEGLDPLDTAPPYAHRLQEAAHEPQRVHGIQTVRNGERVEKLAPVVEVERCFAVIQIDVHVARRDFDRPQEEARSSSGIVRMRAQRARCDAVDSKKSKRPFVPLLIRSDELADHETRVRVEFVRGLSPGLRVPSRPTEVHVNRANEAVEIRDR